MLFARASLPGNIAFYGDFASWDEARRESVGYDEASILNKVLEACRQVKEGKALFERDSVLFYKPDYVWPVLSCLNFAAARNGGRLNVFDFGGSLGSFYFQHRVFLDGLDTSWTVIEQPNFVEVGKNEFATSRLRFATDIDQCDEFLSQSTLLLSGVLHYLPDPTRTVANLLSHPWAMIIVDRTPFLPDRKTDRLTIQKVPAAIYKASYPAWFFARDVFIERLSKDRLHIANWLSFDRYLLDRKFISTEGHCFIRDRNVLR